MKLEDALPITADEVRLLIDSPPAYNKESDLSGLLVFIKPEDTGTSSSYRFPNDEGPDLKFLQSLVGGYIEGCSLDSRMQAYCNEEGKLKGMEANAMATQLLGWSGRDVLAGNVVILFGFPEDE